ncbi:MAG: tRNA (adenosine(37)-N6)-threonylcarbamoyltransferase complex dimerization subunit type 1 TsaB [Gammaproteobacteria bacterium]|nr:tRNA (adenosine(37)-N6)-threonylcarbamoyltransferase complex dimerization subunit type 1 TsaB [Gammaproteobacteria bacterium]MDH5303317.1 tRNA (adenosine(37)-N6)-threonylcarbamoyltransferase complex dimerization subunit type 1 TsaB [Gammaproteobacteria bacterium]MDH5321600.1 tRNA (adenosine(37)-N6)-threonylcarbamoyltransferase complex dimerization subunit type 1 TsaB [Gammaproteobacteria bacterium]
MKILALDTSSIACSVALQIGDRKAARHTEHEREHTRLLLPMIRAVLDELAVELKDLDAIALGNGPGSFIGMRIGASVAQGLAHAANLPIVPVSSLAAVASEVFAEQHAAEVVVTQDAHMNEVYLGYFSRDAAGLPLALITERLHRHEAIAELAAARSGARLAAGAGWACYPALLAANRQYFDGTSKVLYPSATAVLRIAVQALANGAGIAPTEVVPAYLRHVVAAVPAGSS